MVPPSPTEGYETMFKRHEDGTPEPNRREVAAQHHRQAERYKLLSLIEGTKGHLVTERPGDNRQELLDLLAYYQAEPAWRSSRQARPATTRLSGSGTGGGKWARG